MKSLRDESGQALVVVALGLTSLLGFIGLAVDVGSLLHNRRQLQGAADAAAIAAALSHNASGYLAAGKNASASNGFTDGAGGVTVVINPTPASGEYVGQPGYYEALITKNEPTIFMSLFGHHTMPVLARAVAVAKSSNGNGAGCVFTLGATKTDLSVTGNANVQTPQCGINIDSSDKAALSLTGNVTLDAASIGIVGNFKKTGNGTLTPNPTINITPYSDPLSFLPGYTCTTSSCTPSGGGSNITCQKAQSITGNQTVTLTPGCYQGLSFGGNSNVTLSPGTYIINGSAGLQFSGNNQVSGTGVTFYIANGAFGMVGNTILNLSAPTSTSDPFNGILFDQSPGDTSAASLVGNSGSNIQGIMYFPTAAFSLTGNSGTAIYTDFVVSSLSLVGNASFNDYASLGSAVNSPLTVVSLVE
jgi:Flp pilus assembly protein TadG